MECFSIEGNRQWLDGGAMFGNAPKPLWTRWIESDRENRIPLACRSLLIKHEGHNLLFEAGIGCYMEQRLSSRYSVEGDKELLLKNLHRIFMVSKCFKIILSTSHKGWYSLYNFLSPSYFLNSYYIMVSRGVIDWDVIISNG